MTLIGCWTALAECDQYQCFVFCFVFYMDSSISNVLHFKQAKKETEKRKKRRKERRGSEGRRIEGASNHP